MNEERRQADLNFLLQAILTFLDSTGNPRVVYSVLEANLDKLDDDMFDVF